MAITTTVLSRASQTTHRREKSMKAPAAHDDGHSRRSVANSATNRQSQDRDAYRLLSIVVLIGCCSISQAQETISPDDAVRVLIADVKKELTASTRDRLKKRVDRLHARLASNSPIKAAWLLENWAFHLMEKLEDFKAAARWTTSAIDTYERLGKQAEPDLLRALQTRYVVHRRRGKHELEAATDAASCAALLRRADKHGLAATTEFDAASLLVGVDRDDLALAGFHRALRDATADSQNDLIGRCHSEIGLAFGRKGHRRQAIENLDLAAATFRKAADPKREATALYNAAYFSIDEHAYEEAIPRLRRAKILQERLKTPELFQTLINLGQAHGRLGRIAEELALIDRAMALVIDTDPTRLAEALNRRGDVLALLERREEALQDLTRALRIATESNDTARVVHIAYTIACIHTRDVEAAAPWFRRAIDLASAGGHMKLLISAHHGFANSLCVAGRIDQARGQLREAERICKDHGDDIDRAGLTEIRGTIFIYLGRSREAEVEYERALATYEQYRMFRQIAVLSLGRAISCRDRGLLGEAHELAKKAITCFRKIGNDNRTASALSTCASILARMDRLSEAIDVYDKALLFPSLTKDVLADIHLNRAIAFEHLKRWDDVQTELDRAQSHISSGNDSLLARVRQVRAHALGAVTGRTREVLAELSRARRHAKAADDRMMLATISLDHAGVLAEVGAYRYAMNTYRAAARYLSEHLRRDTAGSAPETEERIIVHRGLSHFPFAAFRCYERLDKKTRGDKATLYRILQIFMARGVVRTMSERDGGAASRPSDVITAKLADIDRSLRARRERLHRLDRIDKPRDEQNRRAHRDLIRSLRDEIGALDAQRERLIERAWVEERGNIAPAYRRSTTQGEVREFLGPNEALLEYLATSRGTLLFVTTKSDLTIHDLECSVSPAVEAQRQASRIDGGRDPDPAAIERLGKALFPPKLLTTLRSRKIETLFIGASSALGRLPFEILPVPPSTPQQTSPTLLLSEFDVAYVSSGSAFSVLRTSKVKNRQRLGFVAVAAPTIESTPASGEFRGEKDKAHRAAAAAPGFLHHAAHEVLDAARFFASSREELEALDKVRATLKNRSDHPVPTEVDGTSFRVRLHDAAREGVMLGPDVQAARVIHMACHGVGEPTVPGLSHLLLAPTPGSRQSNRDGYLYLRELQALNLDCELLVLSACNSNVGAVSSQGGVFGFVRAGMIAGAKSVIATSWRVEDAGARRLMTRFYRHWIKDGKSRIRALSDAKRDALATGERLRTWAAYTIWDAGGR